MHSKLFSPPLTLVIFRAGDGFPEFVAANRTLDALKQINAGNEVNLSQDAWFAGYFRVIVQEISKQIPNALVNPNSPNALSDSDLSALLAKAATNLAAQCLQHGRFLGLFSAGGRQVKLQ